MNQRQTSTYLPGVIRFGELNRIPSLADINEALTATVESRQCVQLPWHYGTPPKHYAIAVTLSRDPYDMNPRWIFCRDPESNPIVEWAYATPDVSLIHNMILCTFSDEILTPETHTSYAYVPPATSTTSLPRAGVPFSPTAHSGPSMPDAMPNHFSPASHEPAQIPLDPYAIRSFKQKVLYAESSIYSAQAFQFFLELEFNRYSEHRRPFSVIMITVKRDRVQPVTSEDLIKRISRISQAIGKCDLFCHFEGSSFGIIVPETDDAGARSVVRKIVHELTQDQFGEQNAPRTLWMKIGSASVPEHGEEPSVVLATATHRDHSAIFILH